MASEPIVRYLNELLAPIVLAILQFAIACCVISFVVARRHDSIRAILKWVVDLGALESDPRRADQTKESEHQTEQAKATILFVLSCAAILWLACFCFFAWAASEFAASRPIPEEAQQAVRLVMFAGAMPGQWPAYRLLLRLLAQDFSQTEIDAAREEWQRRLRNAG